MNQYIEAGKKLVPKNLTAAFNSLMGAINIFESMTNKFIPEYDEIEQAKNFQIDNPEQFSSIYQDDFDQEKKKRESKRIKEALFDNIKEFLKKYEFEKIFDARKVGEHFYKNDKKMCCIELKVLIDDKTGLFTQNNGWIDKTKSLNTAVDELSFIFLQCFKTQYEENNILGEFLVSFSEIQEYIYKKLVERFKEKQKQSYRILTKNLKEHVKQCIETKFNIQSLILGLQEQSITMENWKAHIEASYAHCKQELKVKLYLDQNYKVSKVLSYKYIKKMRTHFLSCTLQQLAPFQQYQQLTTEIKDFIELQFVQFFQNKQLTEGICLSNINKLLQYMIYSIDWIQSSSESDEALLLLEELSKYYMNVSQSDSQIFQNQRFSVNILIEYKCHNKNRCQQSKDWWNKNINRDLNLYIIFQIFIISIGLKFNQGKLQIPNYSPAKRNMLIQVLRVLNNGKYDYFNFDILKICEMILYKIYIQILEQIEIQSRTINQNTEFDQQFVEIFLIQQKLKFQVYSNKKQGESFLSEYYKRNHFFKYVIWQDDPNVYALSQTQGQTIKELMLQIQNYNSDIIKIPPPKKLCFQVLSKPQHNSNIVTVCIGGFLSLNDEKDKQWQQLINENSGTVISLHWDCRQIQDFAQTVLKIVPQIAAKTYFGFFSSAVNVLTSNPYEEANQEATRVGQYLAFLIAQYRLFGDCQINFICHSLGSQIVLECVKILDKLYGKYKQQYIQEIMFLGGVADTRKLQKRRWNTVAGRIYNIYSKNDAVLKYILSIAKLFDKPCGLQPIYLGYKQVINCDFTHIINGHNDYYPKLKQILQISDFNNDLKSYVSGIVEEFDI